MSAQKYRKIHNQLTEIWNGIKSGKYKTKKEVLNELLEINIEINSLKNNFNSDILFDLSQGVIRLYELMSVAVFENLSSLAMILNYGIKKDAYFIFNKEAVKIWATKLDWFFPLYNQAEIIKESKDYVLLKSSLSSNLCFCANIVLDEDKNLLLEKYHGEPSAMNFYKDLKE